MQIGEPSLYTAVASSGERPGAFDRLYQAITDEFAGRIALVSSFGAEAIVLLHMVARIDPATPVLLNETGMLFPETLDYQRDVSRSLGLTNVNLIRPSAKEVGEEDPAGVLHLGDTDACCQLRKVAPLHRALKPYAAWITGRKRFQSDTRANVQFAEHDDGRVKLNPLADWTPRNIARYISFYDLPRHPLVAQGYRSIGCAPCTSPVGEGEDARAGRWRGQAKTECGIHFDNGRVVRSAV